MLTRLRTSKHRPRRNIHISLLDTAGEARFGPLQTFWINQRCRLCSASLNEQIEDADVLWIYSQDPLSPALRSNLLDYLRKAKPGARVINHPNVYNAYHQEDAFERLAEGGVSVPRHTFFESDLGTTRVVYKRMGHHTAHKTLERYTGPKDGYAAYEFIDTRGPDGLYRKYRVYYIVGIIHPWGLLFSEDWNAHLGSEPQIQYVFEMTTDEIRQVNAIAKTFGLQYFAVDFLRRNSDAQSFFIDVNIYPNNLVPKATTRRLGYYGSWHTFDAGRLLQLPELSKRNFADVFDEGIRHFIEGEPLPSDPDSLQ